MVWSIQSGAKGENLSQNVTRGKMFEGVRPVIKVVAREYAACK